MNSDQPTSRDAEEQGAPSLIRNAISLLGAALATISLANIIFLFLVTLVSRRSSPYLGVLAFMVFPAFLILGLLLIPVGMWRERRRRRTAAPGEIARLPRIDLNIRAQRSRRIASTREEPCALKDRGPCQLASRITPSSATAKPRRW